METKAASRRTLREDEWACIDPKCAHVNVDKSDVCEMCKSEKPIRKKPASEVGKETAEKFKGLFNADDWMCNKCGNVNWARRFTCNLCNAKKNADIEQRTGYGGGFMDRQQVEYKEKVGDSDEEFDEFGRKKRKGNNDEKSNSKKPRLDDDDEEEDDDDGNLDKYKLFSDESEGDDEDLSKYDLTADPDVIEKKDEVLLKFESVRSATPECSDCSCSCSGGECSCPEDEEPPPVKKEQERSRDRDDRQERSRERSRDKDRDDYKRRHHRSRSGSRERHRHRRSTSRERERSRGSRRDRDYRR